MAEFLIKDEDLISLKDKVVIITGGSSGIGLATVKLVLSLGAKVVSADIQSPTDSATTPTFLFVQTDVTNWAELSKLFKKAKEHYGRIDYVFANAGIAPRADYLALGTDEKGDLKEPTFDVLDINLRSVMNTATLAVHFMKDQSEGGSIVLMGSSTGLQPLRAVDYSVAKHGVLGFGRCYARLVEVAGLPIRINTLAPSWTSTALLPGMDGLLKNGSVEAQGGLAVARAAAYLMVDSSRHGNVVFVSNGTYKEIEKAVLWPAYESIKGEGNLSDDEALERMLAPPAQ